MLLLNQLAARVCAPAALAKVSKTRPATRHSGTASEQTKQYRKQFPQQVWPTTPTHTADTPQNNENFKTHNTLAQCAHKSHHTHAPCAERMSGPYVMSSGATARQREQFWVKCTQPLRWRRRRKCKLSHPTHTTAPHRRCRVVAAAVAHRTRPQTRPQKINAWHSRTRFLGPAAATAGLRSGPGVCNLCACDLASNKFAQSQRKRTSTTHMRKRQATARPNINYTVFAVFVSQLGCVCVLSHVHNATRNSAHRNRRKSTTQARTQTRTLFRTRTRHRPSRPSGGEESRVVSLFPRTLRTQTPKGTHAFRVSGPHTHTLMYTHSLTARANSEIRAGAQIFFDFAATAHKTHCIYTLYDVVSVNFVLGVIICRCTHM